MPQNKHVCLHGHFCEAVRERAQCGRCRKGLQRQGFLCIFYRKQKCLLARAFLRSPTIAQPREAQKGSAQRLAKQGFLCIFYRKQKCLLARAFLRSPSIAQLREAQRGEA